MQVGKEVYTNIREEVLNILNSIQFVSNREAINTLIVFSYYISIRNKTRKLCK